MWCDAAMLLHYDGCWRGKSGGGSNWGRAVEVESGCKKKEHIYIYKRGAHTALVVHNLFINGNKCEIGMAYLLHVLYLVILVTTEFCIGGYV